MFSFFPNAIQFFASDPNRAVTTIALKTKYAQAAVATNATMFLQKRGDKVANATMCLQKRGDEGTWVRDWNYANSSFYLSTGGANRKANAYNKSTPGAPYRWETSWRWQDDNCEIHVTTLDGFCEVCKSLGITRIAFLGDSMTGLLDISLHGLLRCPHAQRVPCPSSIQLETMFHRLDTNISDSVGL